MIAAFEPPTGPASWNDDSLARTLRLDLEDEERRALLGSYAISATLGVAFLLLQQFGPRIERVSEGLPQRTVITVRNLGGFPEPTPMASIDAGNRGAGSPGEVMLRTAAGVRSSIRDRIAGAFTSGAAAPVGDPAGLLRGVAVARAGAGAGPDDAKHVLEYGQGGQGSAVPGRSGMGTGEGASGIGGVGGARGIGRAAVAVSGPPSIPVAPPSSEGATEALGTMVRAREAGLRFCYEESLRSNPSLAGSVTVAVTVADAGSVAGAQVTRRSWSGSGAAEAEACMLRTIRAWHLGSAVRPGTYSFPFSFTR